MEGGERKGTAYIARHGAHEDRRRGSTDASGEDGEEGDNGEFHLAKVIRRMERATRGTLVGRANELSEKKADGSARGRGMEDPVVRPCFYVEVALSPVPSKPVLVRAKRTTKPCQRIYTYDHSVPDRTRCVSSFSATNRGRQVDICIQSQSMRNGTHLSVF
jgi:hypothetical protein